MLLLAGFATADTLSIGITASQPDRFTWAYTLADNGPLDSPEFIFGFLVPVGAAVEVVGTPPGWYAQTDGYSYVDWFSGDYSADVAPGVLISGFILSAEAISGLSESTAYSWDHVGDEPGPVAYTAVQAPVTPIPEPAALLLSGIPLILLSAAKRKFRDLRG